MSFLSANEAREKQRLLGEVGRGWGVRFVSDRGEVAPKIVVPDVEDLAAVLEGWAPGQRIELAELAPPVVPGAQIFLPDGTSYAVPVPPRVNPGPKLYEMQDPESNWAFETQAPPKDPDPSRGIKIEPVAGSPTASAPVDPSSLSQYGFVSWKMAFSDKTVGPYSVKADGVYDVKESDLEDGTYLMVVDPAFANDLSRTTVTESDEDEEDPVWTDV